MKKLRPIVRQTARWDSRSCSRKCIKNTAIWFGSRRKRHQKTLLKITQQIRRHYYYYYFFFFSFFFFLFFFFFFFVTYRGRRSLRYSRNYSAHSSASLVSSPRSIAFELALSLPSLFYSPRCWPSILICELVGRDVLRWCHSAESK